MLIRTHGHEINDDDNESMQGKGRKRAAAPRGRVVSVGFLFYCGDFSRDLQMEGTTAEIEERFRKISVNEIENEVISLQEAEND
nr:hypothetical protein [Tanacetum cinerariifolium]